MSKCAGVLAGLLVPLLLVAAAIATPATAQEKTAVKNMQKTPVGKPIVKEIVRNDKVRAYEATFRPGDQSPSIERPPRVARALKGGTLTLVYPDGKKEKSVYKTGEVKFVDHTPAFAVKNETKRAIRLYIVEMK